jgi:hypothetical protein
MVGERVLRAGKSRCKTVGVWDGIVGEIGRIIFWVKFGLCIGNAIEHVLATIVNLLLCGCRVKTYRLQNIIGIL